MKTKSWTRQLLLLLFLCCLLAAAPAAAQSGVWASLAKVSIKSKKDPGGKYNIEYPVFGEEVRALQGKEILVQGYIIPLQESRSQQAFVFSAYPYNLCFFCGAAGPETVMEVNSQQNISYTTARITLKGRLRLNDSDPAHLMYILDNAVLYP